MSSRNKPENLKAYKSKSTFPQRPHHQTKRSITELPLPTGPPKDHHHHHRSRDHDSDELDPFVASSMAQHPRTSLDLVRSGGTASAYPTGDHDQRMISLYSGPDNSYPLAGTRMSQPHKSKEQQATEDQEKMASTITFVGSTHPRQGNPFIYVTNLLSVVASQRR